MSTFSRGRNPASSWEHIAAQVLSADAASISFQNIDTAYRMFRLTIYVVKDGTGGVLVVRLNNDSAPNYNEQTLHVTGATVTASRAAADTRHRLTLGVVLDPNEDLFGEILIGKQVAGEQGFLMSRVNYRGASLDPYIDINHVRWLNTTDLINRIDLLPLAGNLAANTRAVLEGIQLAA